MEKKENRNLRCRDFGVNIGRFKPGRFNAITDVKGVRVGQTTIIKGSGKLRPGKGPVRTGVTAIIPASGDLWRAKVPAGVFVLNGNGEAAGLMWVQESGILETPIAFTNTHAVGTVHRALGEWMMASHPRIGVGDDSVLPVVMECDDGQLNDIRGAHVKAAHVFAALEGASSGPVEQGAVGAGTGMMAYNFKGGIGSASRVLPRALGGYTVGVLLNANHGRRHQLRFGGKPVGHLLKDLMPLEHRDGSITVAVATDAPLDARQLARLAKRAMLGVGRTGATGAHGSGDVAVAFSTANRVPHYPKKAVYKMTVLSDFHIDPLFEAAADASEEAVLSSLLASRTISGRDGNTTSALPYEKLKEALAA